MIGIIRAEDILHIKLIISRRKNDENPFPGT
jgi:hypothetical protein